MNLVNLFEPSLIQLLKQRIDPPFSAPRNINLHKRSSLLEQNPGVIKQAIIKGNSVPEPTLETSKFREIKSAFFDTVKTNHWMEIQRQASSDGKELKNHWEFLFPEIPFTNERFYFEDLENKSKLYGTLGQEKESYWLGIFFESLQTGKISIFLTYHKAKERKGSVSFQVQSELTFESLLRDKEMIAKQLAILGKVHVTIERKAELSTTKSVGKPGILA
jgi:hypothetical protein